MFDQWAHFCEASKLASLYHTPIPKNNYPQDLPEWYTEYDEMVPEIYPETLFFDPYKSIETEMKELSDYEEALLAFNDDESDEEECSDYEWEAVKNKF